MIKLKYRTEPLKKAEFLGLMVARIKKQCKILGIHPGMEIKIDANEQNYEIAQFLLQKAFKTINTIRTPGGIKALSIEEHASIILNKISELKFVKVNNLFAKFALQDLQELAKIININYKKPEIHKFVDGITKKHPDTVFSLINSLEQLTE